MISTIAGSISVNISMSKYLFIIIHTGVEEDDDLDRFCIRNPKINEDMPIRKETIVRVF